MAGPLVRVALRILVAAAAGLALSGCVASGAVVVDTTDPAQVDVTLWMTRYELAAYSGEQTVCGLVRASPAGIPDSITVEPVTDPNEDTVTGCHLFGAVPVSQLPTWLNAGRFGDRYMIFVPGFAFNHNMEGSSISAAKTSLSITFPGEVLDHDDVSTVTGTTVTWRNPGVAGEDMQAVARAEPQQHPEIPLALLGGLAVGAGVALIVTGRRSTACREVLLEASGEGDEKGAE